MEMFQSNIHYYVRIKEYIVSTQELCLHKTYQDVPMSRFLCMHKNLGPTNKPLLLGRCALPAETFLIFTRNLWFWENVMFLLYKYGYWFSFIFKWLMRKAYCHIDGKVYTIHFPGGWTLPAEIFLRITRNVWFLGNVMFRLYSFSFHL